MFSFIEQLRFIQQDDKMIPQMYSVEDAEDKVDKPPLRETSAVK